MPNRMHPDQVDVDADLVRRLVADQHPRWAGRAIAEVASVGTVNAVYRLGDDLCVRLPLLPAWASSIEREVEWLPWAVLDRAGRARFRDALAVDDAAWARGRGWALRTPIQGLPYYRTTNPGFAAMSRQVLDTVLFQGGRATG